MWEAYNSQRKANVNRSTNSFTNMKSNSQDVVIPDCINVNFREDYNIHSLHEIVKSKIEKESKLTILYDGFILAAQLKALTTPEKNQYSEQKKIQEYKREKDRLCDPVRLKNYIDQANALLEKYDKIPKPKYTSSTDTYYPKDTDLLRIDVILKYLNLASQYINVHYWCTGQSPSNSHSLCYNCGYDMKMELDQKLVIESCSACGFKCNIKKYVPKVKKEHLTSNIAASTCNELGNFIKAMNYYQGKIAPVKYKIEDIKRLLDEYFIENGKSPGDEIVRKYPLTTKGQREGTDVEMMIRAMKAKHIDCYSHINYICREYWKWELPNISHLESVLIDDFVKSQDWRVHLSIEERGGYSNIPVNLRLYLHLRIRDWDCDMCDFKLSSDAEKYIPGFRRMCQLSADPLLVEGCKKF